MIASFTKESYLLLKFCFTFLSLKGANGKGNLHQTAPTGSSKTPVSLGLSLRHPLAKHPAWGLRGGGGSGVPFHPYSPLTSLLGALGAFLT